MPVKNSKKPSQSARENHFLPLKFYENYTREIKLVHVKNNRKKPRQKGKKSAKI